MKKIRFRYMYRLKYGFNGTPWVRECRASIRRQKSEESIAQESEEEDLISDVNRCRRQWMPLRKSNLVERPFHFFPPSFPLPPPLPVPFFVERASHGGREWNKDVLRVTINAATLAQEGESNADDEHG